MKQCIERDEFGRCVQSAEITTDTSKEFIWTEQLTGRKTFGGEPEIIMVPCFPLIQRNLCYYHRKKKEGYFGKIERKE